jgi:small conductance mechanosensitive channel
VSDTTVKIYLIIAVGLLVVNAIAAIVDSLDALSKKYSTTETLLSYYDRLHGLIPLLRRCLEYIIYVCVTTLVLLQVDFIAQFAKYGPGLAQTIGIFFLARMTVAFSDLLVDRSILKGGELSEGERQQQLTVTPIIKSLLGGVIYFIAFVLMLYAVNINPIPILLSAGALGIVVGLGAQPLINDFVSGFLILFENLYLVGDHIETGSAKGKVEAIAFRTTQIRDPSGQLHILRNGQIGEVVNYSREYVFAVVEVGVAYDSNLDHVYQVLRETGKKLKEANTVVLEVTTVDGLTAFGESELLIRTATKVRPGCHTPVANQFRKLIKEAFDREGIEFSLAQRIAVLKDSSEQVLRKMESDRN